MGELVEGLQVEGHRFEVHFEGGPIFSDLQRDPEKEFLEPCGVRHLDIDGREIFLPDTGNRISHGRGYLPHIIHDRIQTLDKIDGIPMGDMHKDRKETFKNMTQGQKRHDTLCVVHRVICDNGPRHPGNISMGQHGPLWRAGCA